MSTVIIHPTQGDHHTSFQATAYFAAREVYGKNAFVYGTKCSEDLSVTFPIDSYASPKKAGTGGFWGDVAKCSTFVYVGHHGNDDGPILNYVTDGDEERVAMQPWPVENGNTSTLSASAVTFWTKVSHSKLKIILVGCHSGETYAKAVAETAKCTVYGYEGGAPAGNYASVKPVLAAIAKGHSGGLKKFS